MNEPSVFKQPELTLPKSATIKYENNFYEHRDAHNLYGYLMHKTSYQAMQKKYQKRPFVLTRSFYLGSHRYGATWTGDTRSRFDNLEFTVPMILTNSISGFSFIGADVGGFIGEGNYYLYIRWYQLGIFYPFFRAHSHIETYRREPWLFDNSTLKTIKNTIIKRYQLLPYIYTVFFQHYKSGLPIIRPLWFKYHNQLSLEIYTNSHFFFGDALLIRPVLNESEDLKNEILTYLPEDERWYSFYDYKEVQDKGEINYKITPDRIGAFIKGGSIIPMKFRVRRSSKLMRFEPITLIVALNKEDSASGIVYFDDEESLDYEETNKYYLRKLMFQKNELFIANLHNEFKIANKLERVIITGLKYKVKSVYYENFYDKSQTNLEFVELDGGVIELVRLKISFDNLWKIKFDLEN